MFLVLSIIWIFGKFSTGIAWILNITLVLSVVIAAIQAFKTGDSDNMWKNSSWLNRLAWLYLLVMLICPGPG
ncbi:MAG: hypothetical protein NUV83_02360 [Candidatus Wolfebacteria bacterium]|nr:hypothetical protein [Candidatus Wolfebacteria bacterium]